MTIKEFEEKTIKRTLPREWIGQGWGYKAEWDSNKPDDIIYIPEYAYDEEDEEQLVCRGCAYSYNDFMNMCDGNEEEARYLFDYVDWQNPLTALHEIEADGGFDL